MIKEKTGRPKIDAESESLRLSIRLPEKIINEIEKLGVGKNMSEKLRDIIEKGINSVKENRKNRFLIFFYRILLTHKSKNVIVFCVTKQKDTAVLWSVETPHDVGRAALYAPPPYDQAVSSLDVWLVPQ